MRGAGNAGIVIANRLLAAMSQFVIRQIEKALDEIDEILFETRLIL